MACITARIFGETAALAALRRGCSLRGYTQPMRDASSCTTKREASRRRPGAASGRHTKPRVHIMPSAERATRRLRRLHICHLTLPQSAVSFVVPASGAYAALRCVRAATGVGAGAWWTTATAVAYRAVVGVELDTLCLCSRLSELRGGLGVGLCLWASKQAGGRGLKIAAGCRAVTHTYIHPLGSTAGWLRSPETRLMKQSRAQTSRRQSVWWPLHRGGGRGRQATIQPASNSNARAPHNRVQRDVVGRTHKKRGSTVYCAQP